MRSYIRYGLVDWICLLKDHIQDSDPYLNNMPDPILSIHQVLVNPTLWRVNRNYKH